MDGRVYIVDGQQHLTTLSLVLIRLRHLARKYGSKLAGWIDNKIAGQTGFEQEFWINHNGHKAVQQALFDGVDLKTIDTANGITTQNMVKNYVTICIFLVQLQLRRSVLYSTGHAKSTDLRSNIDS